MGIILNILGGLVDLFQWFSGYNQRQLGKQQQQNEDEKIVVRENKAELQAAVNRPNDQQLSDELRGGHF